MRRSEIGRTVATTTGGDEAMRLFSIFVLFFMLGCSKGITEFSGGGGSSASDKVKDFPTRGRIHEDEYRCAFEIGAEELIAETDLTSKWQGGGPTWAAIVEAGYVLLEIDMSELFMDPEGDALFITAESRAPLEIASKILGKAMTDKEFRDQAIQEAIRMGIME